MSSSESKKLFAGAYHLYGRGPATASLNTSFLKVARGEGKVVLVPGHSGVGKTSLVHALRAPVKQQNGFLLEGKFNQYEQNIPYSAIRDAFAILAAELRAGTESRRDNWAAQLRQATRGLGRLLIDLVPTLNRFLDLRQRRRI